MSYDVQVWCSQVPDLRSVLKRSDHWDVTEDGYMHEADSWIIGVSLASAESEDVPGEIAALLPNVAALVAFNLSGIASARAEKLLIRTATTVARRYGGAVFDPQTDKITSLSGVTRSVVGPRVQPSDRSLLSLGWWIQDESLKSGDSLDALIDVFKDVLPEAIARRYGTLEPLKFKFADHGEAHFREFIKRTFDPGLIANWPVMDIGISNFSKPGASRQGYRANKLSMRVDVAALKDARLHSRLFSCWEQVSLVLRPFYGDVRILRLRGNLSAESATWPELLSHPVRSIWWNGVPRTSPFAAVIGEPYTELWPSFTTKATVKDGLAFASVDDWGKGATLPQSEWRPPEDIAQPRETVLADVIAPQVVPYPNRFPFRIFD